MQFCIISLSCGFGVLNFVQSLLPSDRQHKKERVRMNRLTKLMCALAALAASMGAFSADENLALWRMSMATNGYVAVQGKTKVSQEMRQRIWKAYREHIGYEGVQMSSPRLVATNECGAIYDLPFTTADGARQNFGVLSSPYDSSQIYLTVEDCTPSQGMMTENVRDLIMERICQRSIYCRLSLYPDMLASDKASITGTFSGRKFVSPFNNFLLVFIDDLPDANWGHSARLAFFSDDLSAYAVVCCNEPVHVMSFGMPITPEVVDKGKAHAEEEKTSSRLLSANRGVEEPYPAVSEGDPSNCFCLILSGGANTGNNHIRYWNDVCFAYNVMVKRYLIPKTNIKVLWASGDPNKDLCVINGNCSQCSDSSFSKDNLCDLDLDGEDDITGPATPSYLRETLASYERTLGVSDQLLIFVTDHGGTWPGFNTKFNDQATLCLWRGDDYSLDMKDSELADLTKNIKCPVAFVLETCFSGGFIKEIQMSAKNRFIATADGYDVSMEGSKLLDAWVYHYFSALCGYYPKQDATKFWNVKSFDVRVKGTVCDADYNKDGKVSFEEAALFAENANFFTAENGCTGQIIDFPDHKESTANLGKKMFMTQYADAPAIVVKEKVLTPTLSPSASSLGYAPCMVTASCGTSGATIRYTLDGTEPNARSTVYSGGITVADDTVVSIRAFKSGMDASDAVSIAYTVKKAAPEKPLITSVSQGDSASGIVVYWSGGAGTGYYAIRRSESASMANAVTIADQLSANVYSYLDDSAAAGRDHYYQVVAFNDYGSTASAISQAGYRTLSAPVSVNVSWISSEKKFQISWGAVAGASHYMVYRSIDDAPPVAISSWQTRLSMRDAPDVAAGSKIRYYVTAAVSSSGQGMTALVSSSVQTMPDIRDWQLIIDRNATHKCQLVPGGFKQFNCSLKYSDGTFEKENFTTGVKWDVVQVGSHVSHSDSDGSYMGASGIGGIYTAPSTILRVESGNYEENIVLRATYTKNGETRSCEYPIIVSNRKIVYSVSVGVPESYLAPGEEMPVTCTRFYLNGDATGAEDIGEETYAIAAGGGAALADDGTLTAFPVEAKTNVTIQVTYSNADGFFTATKSLDIAPQVITTLEFEIPALGGYSPTNEIGKVGYRKPGLNGLSWSLVWNVESWVSQLFYQVTAGSLTNLVNIGRGSGRYTTPDGTAQFAFYADRNDGPSRTEILPLRWNGGGLDVVIRQKSAAQVDLPVLSVNVGSLNANCYTPEAVMRYATDGEEPSANSPLMPNGLSFDENTECAVKAFAEWMIASDTVYADVVGKDSQWDEVDISFDAGQVGLTAPAKRTYKVNETFGELPSFPRTNGLYFKGWSLHEGSEKLVSASDYVPSSDATLYAVWSPVAADKPSWVALPWNFKSTMTAIMKVYDDVAGSYLDPSVCIIGIEDTDGVCRGSSENGFGDTQSELNGQNGLYVFGIYSQIESGQETGLKIRIWNRQKGFMSVADASVLFTAGSTLGDEANPYVIHVTMNVCDMSLAKTGWHLVSFSALPDDPSPANVFADVADKIDQVVQGSKVWKPRSGGRLTEIEIGLGYWVRTKADNVSWVVAGVANPGVEIALSKGWNLVGYPLLESASPATVLKTAYNAGKFTQIVDGSKVYPGRLTTLEPGKGYWFYAPTACTISFDEN